MTNEFQKYAIKHHGISSLRLEQYQSIAKNYLTPYIIEERPLNITQLDVFSRLMKDRIIFLGVPIYDDVANIIQAQLLF
jgi:ATP-dependent Clp protease protease subunit